VKKIYIEAFHVGKYKENGQRIKGSSKPNPKLTIYCKKNSVAHKYAVKNKLKYKL
jgi:hypothetical protein